MKTHLHAGDATTLAVDVLGIAVLEDEVHKGPAFKRVDEALAGVLGRAIRDERFSGRRHQTFSFHTHGALGARRVFLYGLGKRAKLAGADAAATEVKRFAAALVRTANGSAAGKLAAVVDDASANLLGTERLVEALADGIDLGDYRFDRYRSREREEPPRVTEVYLAAAGAIDEGMRIAEAVSAGRRRARDLVNEPASEITPRRFADIARQVAAHSGLLARVLGPREARAHGMGLLLGVGQGSTEEVRLVHLIYKPRGAAARLAFVGKGITFDSGGLCLKQPANMMDMKTDMAGGAAVLGAMEAVAALKPKVEVHGIIALAENMPSGTAYRLGDVLHSKRGLTVEITNTDAEGRLVLADALAYAAEQEPALTIDLATLTGACMVALGPEIAGLFSSDDAVRDQVQAAAQRAGEAIWPLPLSNTLKSQLKSDIADLKNAGDRYGGAITAALFLREFAEGPWAHLDIAGPSTVGEDKGIYGKGASGFGVATLVHLALSYGRTEVPPPRRPARPASAKKKKKKR